MENVVVSMFCGMIIFVDVLGAYFGWIFIKNNFNFPSFILALFMHRLSFIMSVEVTSFLGVRNDSFIQILLLIPILISAFTSLLMKGLKKKEKEIFF